MLVIVAETSWIKSRVNWGANSASFSLKFKTNAMGSPDMKPATEDVKNVNNPGIASLTFICDDRTLVVLEVVANFSKEVVSSASKFLVVQINT